MSLSSRSKLLIFAGVVVTATTAVFAFVNTRISLEEPEVNLAVAATPFARMTRCLLGDTASDDRSPATRYRDIWLSAHSNLEATADGRVAPGSWPRRCGQLARTAMEAIEQAHIEHHGGKLPKTWPPMMGHLKSVTESLEAGDFPAVADIDPLFRDAATRIRGAIGDTSDVKLPPEPAQPLRGLRALSPPPAMQSARLLAGALRVLQPRGTRACRLLASAGPTQAHCHYYPDSMARSLEWSTLAASDDDADSFLVGASLDGDGGVYALSSGERLLEASLGGGNATVMKDGTVLGFSANDRSDDGKLRIHRKAPDGSLSAVELSKPKHNSWWRYELVWDQLMWLQGDGYRRRLGARDVGGAKPGPVVKLGRVPMGAEMRACRTDQALFVHFSWLDHDKLAVLTADGWVTHRPKLPEGNISCAGASATIVSVDTSNPQPAVKRARCSAAGCKRSLEQLAHVQLGGKPPRAQAIELGDRTLLVWIGDGLRMRLAPYKQLDDAKDVVLFDNGQGDDGPLGTPVGDIALFARGEAAVLLLDTGAGQLGIALDAAGTYRPLKIVDAGAEVAPAAD